MTEVWYNPFFTLVYTGAICAHIKSLPFPERVRNISVTLFLTFYLLKVDISLIVHNLHLKLYKCIKNFAVEGTVSQICYIGPGSFSRKYRKTYIQIYKKLPVFLHKI